MSTTERKERERARRHELIISTARELAEEQGWEAVTTRRLSERIEYSQPVLYSHFSGKDAIVTAVALQGFGELAETLERATAPADDPRGALEAAVHAYAAFAEDHPATYDAMFSRRVDLPFGQTDTPAPLRAGFEAILRVLTPFAGGRDPGVLAEVGWSGIHGLVTLARDGRLPPADRDRRLALLIDQLAAPVGRAHG